MLYPEDNRVYSHYSHQQQLLLPYTTYNSYLQQQQHHRYPHHSHDYDHFRQPVTDPHGPSNTLLPYVQNVPHLNWEAHPSFPYGTSRHLYQHQPHYQYPSTLSSAPSTAAMNASLPSWSAGASETGTGYSGLGVRPENMRTEEPAFPHEYLSESSYPYAQPYPFYHDHFRENPSTLAQDRSHRNIQPDIHFTTHHAHHEQSHYRHYPHPYEPPLTTREGALSPPGTIPNDSQRWHESTDRRDNIIGHRVFDKSTTLPSLPSIIDLTSPNPARSLSLKRNSEEEFQSSGLPEIASQYRSPPSNDPSLHSSTHPGDETPRYPSPTVTPRSSADSLTELANASLMTTSKSTTVESAYPSPSSSTFSEKPFTLLSASPMSQGLRRDQYTPPNNACYSCGGSNVELVGDGYMESIYIGTHLCKECGKPSKHNTNTTTQQREHTAIPTSQYPLSESERAQILDAASILFTIKSTALSSSSIPSGDDIHSRPSTPGTITQPSSPQLDHLEEEDISSALLITSLLTDAGSSVIEETKPEKIKGEVKGRKAKRRKFSA